MMELKAQITADYGTHEIKEPWVSTEFYCLNCGKQEVWFCNDGGDYYQGEANLCLACGHGWNLPGYPAEPDDIDKQRLRQLSEFKQQNEEAARGGEQQNSAEG